MYLFSTLSFYRVIKALFKSDVSSAGLPVHGLDPLHDGGFFFF